MIRCDEEGIPKIVQHIRVYLHGTWPGYALYLFNGEAKYVYAHKVWPWVGLHDEAPELTDRNASDIEDYFLKRVYELS